MSVLELLGSLLGSLREFSINILFHDEPANGYAIRCSPATILYIDGNGNLRLIHRGKAHEYGVVVATVLSSTRLTTSHKVVLGQLMASTTSSRGAHTLYYIVIGCFRGLSVTTFCI